jgi:hypothetical protein
MTQRLLELASNPYFWVAGIVAIISLALALSRPRLFVYLAAGFAVLISITPPTILDPEAYISLWGPLESIRTYNRFLAVLGGAGILLAMKSTGAPTSLTVPASVTALLFTHGLILTKNLLENVDTLFVALLFVGFVIVVFIYWTLLQQARNTKELIELYLRFAAVTGGAFLALTFFQFGINRAATSIVGGRFHGITNNPQMFVISIAPFFPVMYYLFAKSKVSLVRVGCIVAALLSLYWCYLTGSRLALVLIVVGFGVYYQFRIAELFGVVIAASCALLLLSTFDTNLEFSNDSRVFSTTDTRTAIWRAQWEEFINNPLMGKSFQGSRVTFGESTWLGAAAGLGIIGLIPMLYLGARTTSLAIGLWNSTGIFADNSQRAMLLSIVAVSMVGTLFEAYLFGVLTLPMTMFLVTVMMMERLETLKLQQLYASPFSRHLPPLAESR